MQGDHAYYTTRQALPLMEIGRLLQPGRRTRPASNSELYAASDYGQKESANGVYLLLGDLYEEAGEWDKARALYEHYAQFPCYKNDAELRKRLGLPPEDDRTRAATWIAELQNPDPAARRNARLRLYDLITACPIPRSMAPMARPNRRDRTNSCCARRTGHPPPRRRPWPTFPNPAAEKRPLNSCAAWTMTTASLPTRPC